MKKNKLKKAIIVSIFMILVAYCAVFREGIIENFQSLVQRTGSPLLKTEEQALYMVTVKYMYENGTIARSKDVYAFVNGEDIDITIPDVEGATHSLTKIEEHIALDETAAIPENEIDEDFVNRVNALDYAEAYPNDNYSNIYKIYYTVIYNPANSKYVVNTYLENVDDDEYTLSSSRVIEDDVYVGDSIEAVIPTIVGYKFNSTKSITKSTVAVTGDTALSLYFDRDINYIYLDSDGGTYYEPIDAKLGSTVDLSAYVPVRPGYKFNGWVCLDGRNGEEIEIPTVMPDNDIYFKATWEIATADFAISYFFENPDDDGYTRVGQYVVSDTDTESLIKDITSLNTYIQAGFEQIKENETQYFTYNSAKSLESIGNAEVLGDGTTNVNVYYDRNEYTLTFHLGTVSGNRYTYSYSSGSTQSNTTTNYYVTMNGTRYYAGTNYYTITAKYQQNIAALWPTPSTLEATTISNNKPYVWQFQKQNDTTWTNQISPIYTLTYDLITYENNTYHGADLYLNWKNTSNNYTIHYYLENIDGNGFTEKEEYGLKTDTNNFGYKEIEHFYHTANAATARSGDSSQLELYYYRNSYNVYFVNGDEYVLPNASLITNPGFTTDSNHIVAKYEADISCFEDFVLSSDQCTIVTNDTKDYVFGGWYLDPSYTVPVDWTADVEDDMILYAKWNPPTYEVTIDLNDGEDDDAIWTDNSGYYTLDNGLYVKELSGGTTLKSPTTPTRDGYVFLGWYYLNDGKEQQYLFSESQQVYRDFNIYAKWEAGTSGTVHIRYYKGKLDDSGNVVTDLSFYSDSDKLIPDQVMVDLEFDSYQSANAEFIPNPNGKMYIVDQYTKTVRVSTNDDQNVINFFYIEKESEEYKVYYVKANYDENGNLIEYSNGEVPPAEERLKRTKTVYIDELDSLLLFEYAADIDGYEVDAYLKPVAITASNNKIDGLNNTLYFYYTPISVESQFKVRFFFMDQNREYPDEPDYVYDGKSPVGTFVRASEYTNYLDASSPLYEGHELDLDKTYILLIVVTESNDSVLDLYFKTKVVSVQYDTNGGDWNDDEDGDPYIKKTEEIFEEDLEYGDLPTEPEEPTKDGYIFDGWYVEDEDGNPSDEPFDFNEPVKDDIHVKAKWIEAKTIEIEKVWADKNDQDGIRPSNVTLSVYANGVPLENGTIVLSEQNQWKYTLTDIPLKDSNDNVITYSIVENSVDGYTPDLQSYTDNNGKITITNTHNVETKTVKVIKKWNDSNNQDGIRPESVDINIKSGEYVYDSIALTSADATSQNEWVKEIQVPVYKEGSQGVVASYTLEENVYTGTGYSQTYDYSVANELTVVNSYTPKTRDITVNKVWDDQNDRDGIRKNNNINQVEVKLLADGVDIGTYVLVDTKIITGLPVNKNGQPIVYTIEEITNISGYEQGVVTENNGIYTVTNSHTPETKSIVINEVWIDDNNRDGIRPSTINVDIRKDDGTLVKRVVLSEENNWTITEDNLPKYENGEEIHYVIEEERVNGYTTDVEREEDVYTITNVHEPEKISLSVLKQWDDNDNQDGLRPQDGKVTINVLGNGNVVTTVDIYTSATIDNLYKNENGQPIVYTLEEVNATGYTPVYYENTENNWTIKNVHEPEVVDINITNIWDDEDNIDGLRPHQVVFRLTRNGELYKSVILYDGDYNYTFEGLSKYTDGVENVYDVTIEVLQDYTQFKNVDGYDFTFINSRVPSRISLTVTKCWLDNHDSAGIRPSSVKFTLVKNGVTMEDTYIELTASDAIESSGNSLTDETNPDTWVGRFENLIEYENGEPIRYSIVEDSVSTSYGAMYSTVDSIVYNVYPTSMLISVDKEWDDGDNADGIRPSSVQVQLYRDGVAQEDGLVTLDDSNNWHYDYPLVDKYDTNGNEYQYSVEEVIEESSYVPSYEIGIDNEYQKEFIVTNTYDAQITSRTVSKVWDDNNDQDGMRPDYITVHLLADGNEVDAATLNDDNSWTYTFDNLYLNNEGVQIDYTIEEDPVEFYTSQESYDEVNKTYTFTNSHETTTKNYRIKKTWNDNDNQDNIRPNEIYVDLLANDEIIQTYTLSNENDYLVTTQDLPIYSDGEKIKYEVAERETLGYTPRYSLDRDLFTITNTHIAEEINIKIEQIWIDYDNRDGIRPTNVKVTLIDDEGNEIVENIILNDVDDWNYTVTVPKYSQGEEAHYTIKEIEIPGYVTTIDEESEEGVIKIISQHDPQTKSIHFIKQWVDDDDLYGIRPDTIEIEIYGNGNLVTTQELKASENYEVTVGGLFAKEKGVDIDYTFAEVGNTNYITTQNVVGDDVTFTNTAILYNIKTNIISVGGTISGQGEASYEKVVSNGSNSKDVVITPATGYEIETITINGQEQTLPADKTQSYVLPKIENITEDKEILVGFKKQEFNITTQVIGGHGSITGEGENPFEKVSYGENSTKPIVITPDEGYEISKITYNGVEKQIPENGTISKIINVREDILVAVEFKKIDTKVKVIYESTTGKILGTDEIDGQYGDEYETEPIDVEHYFLIEVPDNASGVMYEEEIVVKYIYEYRPEFVLIKEVRGNYASLTEKFTFIMDFKNLDNTPYTSNTITYKVVDTDGTVISSQETDTGSITVDISHNQKVRVIGVAENTKYSVREVDARTYVTRINNVENEDKYTMGIHEDATEVLFTNIKHMSAQTGVVLYTMPFVIAAIAITSIFVMSHINKKRKNRDID